MEITPQSGATKGFAGLFLRKKKKKSVANRERFLRVFHAGGNIFYFGLGAELFGKVNAEVCS